MELGNAGEDFYTRARAVGPEVFDMDALRATLGGEWRAIRETNLHQAHEGGDGANFVCWGLL